jgi:hypothetical protein
MPDEARNPQSQPNYDSPWKDTVQQFLRPFLALCFPHVEPEIDWSREPEFLEQELREAAPESDLGPQRVDQLVKVWRVDGTQQWLLLHIEVQTQPDPELPQRLFHYHSRLTEKYGWRVATLCLLADISPGYRPHAFHWEFLGCSHHFSFPTRKLLDFADDELRASDNPVALIIRAHLAAKRTRLEEPLRYRIKRDLLRELADRGIPREDFTRLLRLIDWLIRLQKQSAIDLTAEIRQYYRSKSDSTSMPYVSTFERIIKEEGFVEGQRGSIIKAVALRFEESPEALPERLALISDIDRLDQVLALVLRAGTLAELEHALDEMGI